jgi:aspartate/methionine/tyrosine aminotransferase
MLTEYQDRRDQLMRWLGEEPRFAAAVPRGAFYLFPSVEPFLSPNGCRTSLEFADRLLETEHVVLTAGEAFDASGYLRISYAASLDRIREGVTRLIRFARSL